MVDHPTDRRNCKKRAAALHSEKTGERAGKGKVFMHPSHARANRLHSIPSRGARKERENQRGLKLVCPSVRPSDPPSIRLMRENGRCRRRKTSATRAR